MNGRGKLVLSFLIFVALGIVLGVLVAPYVSPVFRQLQQLVGVPAVAQIGQVREYYIEIKGADIEIAPGVTWKAWTYNGTVPGPTLMARVGDLIRVRAVNKLDLTHSLHPHMPYYELQHDGSQINIVTGVGKGSMIPPGGEWTYEWPATKPGIWYYHCHSGGPLVGGGHRIVDHMLMGL
ncbi:MAG: multicopper oxidase domain-containing protein, partial [Nitrososphaeria archaeon]|nr:multicopper oxidase domain-containing protein [Nitrososphaeria archaeon]